ncbi:MAG: hypothetical protein KAU20_02475 [Nanoarchaeota archaeon]|nr:hypothetical protein [Nanoarchaeota archaeon]
MMNQKTQTSITELIKSLTQYLADYLSRKFTGNIVVTINCKDGGIASTSVNINHDLPIIKNENKASPKT